MLGIKDFNFGFEVGVRRPFVVLHREPWTKMCTFINDVGKLKSFDFELSDDLQDDMRELRNKLGEYVREDQLELVLDGAFNFEAVIYFIENCNFLGDIMAANSFRLY